MLNEVQIICGSSPSLRPILQRAFSGLQRTGREAECSPQNTITFKNAWNYNAPQLTVFTARCLTYKKLKQCIGMDD
jgi:hypothetical protein